MFVRGLPGSLKKDMGRRLNNRSTINKRTGVIKMQIPKDKDSRTGDIFCATIPTKAKVYVDDILQGKLTSFAVSFVPVGLHVVVFELPGYERSKPQTVKVVSNQHSVATFNFEDATKEVPIRSEDFLYSLEEMREHWTCRIGGT